MFESLIFGIILIFLNLVLIIKPMPLIGFVIGVFTFLIGIVFVSDATLPVNSPTPWFAIFIIVFGIICILAQTIDLRR